VALTVLDAGVVIAFFDANDPHHDAARDALTAATDAQDDLVLPASAYSEVLVRPFMRGDTAVDRIDGLIDELPARVEAASRSIASAPGPSSAQPSCTPQALTCSCKIRRLVSLSSTISTRNPRRSAGTRCTVSASWA